jgi:hypothetical protein
VFAESPERVIECEVTKVATSALAPVYDDVSPYCTWLVDVSSVVQDIVTPEVVIEETVGVPEMAGAVVSDDATDLLAVHAAFVPPPLPVQLQFEELPCVGLLGEEGDADPVVQYVPVGNVSIAE